MPTNRRFRTRARVRPLAPAALAMLRDEPAGPLADPLEIVTSDDLRRLWNEHGEAIIAEWAIEHPGMRPSAWWRWSAPRWTPDARHAGRSYVADLPEPRRRLDGTGTPAHEVLAHVPSWPLGIPDQWVTRWDADYYTGRARDVHGKPIGVEFLGHDFAGVAIDPRDPPRYESQAAYLARHKLLLRGERARLTPQDFLEEVVLPLDDDAASLAVH